MDYTKIDRFLSMAQEYGAMNILQKTSHNPHLSSTITRKAINKFTALKNRAPQDSSV
jgi:spore coat polysaccharide biosynthesis protein SpsF (cytidylyltransferase family)